MLGLLKNLFSQSDDKALSEAIRNGAFLVDVRTPGEFASGSVAGACSLSERRSVITTSEKDFARYNSFSNKKDWFLNFCLSEDKNIIIKPILFYII